MFPLGRGGGTVEERVPASNIPVVVAVLVSLAVVLALISLVAVLALALEEREI